MRYGLLSLLLLAAAPAWAEDGCPLGGTWRSSEAKTLADMRARGTVPEQVAAALSRGFFGRAVVEYTCPPGGGYLARGYFVDLGRAADAPWWPYRVVEQGAGFVVVEVSGPGGPPRRLRFEFEGDCYRTFIEGLGFYEYFCRVRDTEG